MKLTNNILRRRGFTLVELLVVISIIAVLMGVLMPALQRVRSQAKGLLCATKLKDIGNVMMMYVTDNDGELPTNTLYQVDASTGEFLLTSDGQRIYGRWVNLLAPYYEEAKGKYDRGGTGELFTFEMYKCPTQKKYEGGAGAYGYNKFFESIGSGAAGWRKLDSVKLPSSLPLLADLNGGPYVGTSGLSGEEMGGGGLFLNFDYPHPKAFKYGFMGGDMRIGRNKNWNTFGPAPNHGPKCNFLMADCHVEARDVCTDGKWPWEDHKGTAFHPRRNTRVRKPF